MTSTDPKVDSHVVAYVTATLDRQLDGAAELAATMTEQQTRDALMALGATTRGLLRALSRHAQQPFATLRAEVLDTLTKVATDPDDSEYTHVSRPVRVRARQFTTDTDPVELAAWCGGQYLNSSNGYEDVIYLPNQGSLESLSHVPRDAWIFEHDDEFTALTDDQFRSKFGPY